MGKLDDETPWPQQLRHWPTGQRPPQQDGSKTGRVTFVKLVNEPKPDPEPHRLGTYVSHSNQSSIYPTSLHHGSAKALPGTARQEGNRTRDSFERPTTSTSQTLPEASARPPSSVAFRDAVPNSRGSHLFAQTGVQFPHPQPNPPPHGNVTSHQHQHNCALEKCQHSRSDIIDSVMLRSKLEQSERDLVAAREETTMLKVAFIRLQELAGEKEHNLHSEREVTTSLREERDAFQQALEQCAAELEACHKSKSDVEGLLRLAEERSRETTGDCRRLQAQLSELEAQHQRLKSSQMLKDQTIESAKVSGKDISEVEKRYAEAVSTISALEKRLLLVEREKKEFLGTIQELQRQLDGARAAGVLSGVDLLGIGNPVSPSYRLN